MDEYDVEIYTTQDGKAPFTNWIHSIKDSRAIKTIFLRIQRVRQGNFGDCKHFDGISELRIDYGPGLRVYFAKVGNRVIMLLGGGDKSTQNKDIKCSKVYLEDYKRNKNE